MELDKFLEADILEFLNALVHENENADVPGLAREEEVSVFNLTRDYAKEARDALGKGDTYLAVKNFSDLKEEYRTFPPGSGDQVKAFDVLTEIYGKIKEYLESNPQYEGKIPEDLGAVLPSQPLKQPAASYEDRRQAQIDLLRRETERKKALEDEIRKKLNLLDRLLAKSNYVAATVLYQNIKVLFRQMPAKFEKDREKLFDEIVTCYYQIKKGLAKAHSQGKISEIDAEKVTHPGKKDEETEARLPVTGKKDVHAVQEDVQKIKGTEKLGVTREEILSKIEAVKELIVKRDARNALVAYESLKKNFDDLEAPKEVKKHLFNDIMSVYNSAQALESRVVDRKMRPKPKAIIKKSAKTDLLKQIRSAKVKAYGYLDRGQARSAVLQYNKIKKLFDQIPGSMKEEKAMMFRELNDLHDRVKTLSVSGKEFDFKEKFAEVTRMLDSGQVKEANNLFLEMKHKAVLEHDPVKQQKLHSALDRVKARMNLVLSTPGTRRGE